MITDNAPDHVPVLLLDMVTVILFVGTRASEGYPLIPTVIEHMPVDKLTAII